MKHTSAELLFGSPTAEDQERIKRRRVDIENGCRILEKSDVPDQALRFNTSLWLLQNIGRFHTAKATDPVHGRVHVNEAEINPLLFTKEELAKHGILVDKLFDDAYDTVLPSGSKTIAQIIGSLQREMLMNAVIESATWSVVTSDPARPLHCLYCNTPHLLLTIAKEHDRKCCHPSSESRMVWAVHDGEFTFSSERVVENKHERKGSAICLSCLYEKVVKDENLKEAMLDFYEFSKRTMDSLEGSPDGRCIGCCQIDDTGSICLFTLSFVSPDANGATSYIGPVMRSPHRTLSPNVILQDVTLDPTPMEHDNLRDAMHYLHNFARAKTVKMTDVKTELSAIKTDMEVMGTQVARVARSSDIYNQTNGLPFQTTEDALEFVQTYESVVLRYMDAQKILIREEGDKMMLFRPSEAQKVTICQNCGGYGHNCNKKCIMCLDPKSVPKGGLSMVDHFGQNVLDFAESQKAALTAAVDLQQWETRAINAAFMEAASRRRKGQLSRRLAPNRDYLLHGDKLSKKKGKDATCLSPSIPFSSLGSYTVEELKKRIDMSFFMNRSVITKFKEAWQSNGHFDVTDFLAPTLQVRGLSFFKRGRWISKIGRQMLMEGRLVVFGHQHGVPL